MRDDAPMVGRDAANGGGDPATSTGDGGLARTPLDTSCPDGQGWNIADSRCHPCQLSPGCNDTGETGHRLIWSGPNGTTCICETQTNYYALGQGKPAACDNDGDGWVVDDAQAAIESDDPVMRNNAHCQVRRVLQIVLHNEQNESFVAEDFSHQFEVTDRMVPRGLPLYESARNDGVGSALPMYGHGARARAFAPEELNSLTKACSDSQADFDDNGVSDVQQDATTSPKLHDTRFALAAYYQKYMRFSYFFELHDAWYADEEPVASYHIAEKSRNSSAEHSVPLAYLAVSGLDGAYTRTCVRHPDSAYIQAPSEGTPTPSLSTSNTTGADFIEFSAADAATMWRGMTHHSQYKCILPVSQTEYDAWPGGPANERDSPQLMFLSASTPSTLQRKDASGSVRTYSWIINDCVLDAVENSRPAFGSAQNSKWPNVICSASTPTADVAAWAAVTYEDYTDPYLDAAHPGGYHRGCANACIEPVVIDVPHDCTACLPSAFGDRSMVASPTDLPVDDGNPCTTESCDSMTPQHIERAPGSSCGDNGVCQADAQCSACLNGTHQCTVDGSSTQTCENGNWAKPVACMGTVCSGSGVCGDCQPNAARCATDMVSKQTCDGTGHWGAAVACTGSVCSGAGECGVCQPSARRCSDDLQSTEICSDAGQWQTVGACANGCVSGKCRSVCSVIDDGTTIPCRPPCFAAGTAVTLADGSTQAIETIQPGQRVLAYDVENRQLMAAVVTARLVHPNTEALVLLNDRVLTTPEHRFFADGSWLAASHLTPAHTLLQLGSGAEPLVDAPVLSTESRSGPITTYNLEIAGVHTYFAGGFLVHNLKSNPLPE